MLQENRLPLPLPRRTIPAMSGEVWAIIGAVSGAVFGALAAGGMNLWNAKLQRDWSAKDAELAADRAWKQEKRSRLFERKQEAHLAYLGSFHDTVTILQRPTTTVSDRISVGRDAMETMGSLQHRFSELQAYASTESTELAAEASKALIPLIEAVLNDEHDDRHRDAVNDARRRYANALRADLGVDDEDPILASVMRSIMDAEKSIDSEGAPQTDH